MYYDLVSNRLIICLVPNKNEEKEKDGLKIRQVESNNPQWYSELCKRYPRKKNQNRKCKRTIIKRERILSILNLLKNGKESKSKYAYCLKEIAESMKKDLNLTENEMLFFNQFGELPKPFNNEF